ncbi:MAG: DinB family protein [Fuerstiella sp.]
MTVSFRFCLAILSLIPAAHAFADSGDPVAVRRWAGATISLETMWDLNLVIDTTGEASDKLKNSASKVVSFSDEVQHVLHRKPNSSEVLWERLTTATKVEPNAVTVTSFKIKDAAAGWAIQVAVDDVSVLCVDLNSIPKDTTKAAGSVGKQDVVIVNANDVANLNQPQVKQFLEALSPQSIVANPNFDAGETADDFKAAMKAEFAAVESAHNTLAIAAGSKKTDGYQFFSLADKPEAMPTELADLFLRMESSCAQSQKVFAKLSTSQMNWKPSNGTHTPRWNTEHMMGRQLLFFSQIYKALDPAIPALNLNPKQMPADYKYAHQDWTGAEEALQMERVSKFTRRFAYLMHDLDVNRRAPGSRWPTLKALLLQMENHYSEHTANTVKKFDLEDWPKQ